MRRYLAVAGRTVLGAGALVLPLAALLTWPGETVLVGAGCVFALASYVIGSGIWHTASAWHRERQDYRRRMDRLFGRDG